MSDSLSGTFTDPASVMVLQGIARATEDAGVALLLVPERGGVRDAVVDAFCLQCAGRRASERGGGA